MANGGYTSIEDQVPGSVLLVSSGPTNVATVEGKIADKAGRSGLREDTLMLGA